MIPKYIIIHHSLTKDNKTVSWNAIRKYHMSYAYNGEIISPARAIDLIGEGKAIKKPWSDIGYHYGIELVGEKYEILIGRMMNETGAHCIQQGMNSKSIGICCIGNFDANLVPEEQWKLCINLVRSLVDVLRLSKDCVYGHREFASYKNCPGNNFDLDYFRNNL